MNQTEATRQAVNAVHKVGLAYGREAARLAPPNDKDPAATAENCGKIIALSTASILLSVVLTSPKFAVFQDGQGGEFSVVDAINQVLAGNGIAYRLVPIN
jgi:hypothetical protein